jgi:AbrB family looped-hinge helix DNA binding protein
MASAKVTSKGQITIPLTIRQVLGLEPGDRITFVVRDDGTVEVRAETVDLLSLAGSVSTRRKGVSLADMDRAIRERAASSS